MQSTKVDSSLAGVESSSHLFLLDIDTDITTVIGFIVANIEKR